MVRLTPERNRYAAELFETIQRHMNAPDPIGIRNLVLDLDFIALWDLSQGLKEEKGGYGV